MSTCYGVYGLFGSSFGVCGISIAERAMEMNGYLRLESRLH